jgi:predicted lipase
LSFLVYKDPVEIRQRAAGLIPNSKVAVHNGVLSNGRTVVFSGDKEIFVVFRGTVATSVRSHIVNFRSVRAPWGNGLVHRGFLSLCQRVSPFISQALRDYEFGTKDLYFTGHSQGGAAAYLAAMTFALRFGSPSPSAVYTFGQPRAGDAQFSRDAEKRLERKLSRIVNGLDVIVGVPFVWNGYDHTREYLQYGQNWLISRRSQVAGQRWPLSARLGDHSMLEYLRRSHVNESLPPV